MLRRILAIPVPAHKSIHPHATLISSRRSMGNHAPEKSHEPLSRRPHLPFIRE
jgi:hypothetical protein